MSYFEGDAPQNTMMPQQYFFKNVFQEEGFLLKKSSNANIYGFLGGKKISSPILLIVF